MHYFKKHLYLACFFGIIFSVGCDDKILDEVPIDFLAPENAYSSISGIQQGINGLYFQVRNAWYNDSYQDALAINLAGLGTDVGFHGENPGGNRKLVNYQSEMTPTHEEFVDFFWIECYRLIKQANLLIESIEEAEVDWNDENQKKSYLAEARFFRSWAYRFLVALYGDVPLITEPIKSPKNDFTRESIDKVFALIEEDLIYASNNLPGRKEVEGPGRITKAAALNYLSEIYLSQKKFSHAIEAASKVIDGGEYALMTERFGSTIDVFGSGDVYLDLFAYGNQNLAENTEAIWVIQFEPDIVGGGEFPGERAFGPAYFRIGDTPDGYPAFRGDFVDGEYTGYLDTLGRPVAYFRPTNYMAYYIWESDWDNDIRNAPHNIKRDFYFDNPESNYHGQRIDFNLYPKGSRNSLLDTCQYIFPFIMKHADPLHHFTRASTAGGGFTHKDIYQIRLAETILLRAEAYIGLGDNVNAATDINLIRSRANASLINSDDVDIEFLLDERARELFGEEFRHITLRRTGKLLERVRKYCNNPIYPACNIQDHNILFPIPQNEIDLSDGNLNQNPGY